jgi:small-conductance mechanosensitive channel
LRTLGETALLFELTYFVRQPSVNPLLDLQQAVNFRILDEFERQGVDFAYPTQRLLLESQSAPARGA